MPVVWRVAYVCGRIYQVQIKGWYAKETNDHVGVLLFGEDLRTLKKTCVKKKSIRSTSSLVITAVPQLLHTLRVQIWFTKSPPDPLMGFKTELKDKFNSFLFIHTFIQPSNLNVGVNVGIKLVTLMIDLLA